MEIKELHTFLREDLSRVETLIRASLHSDVALLEATNQRLREHPGKMLRPMLALLVAGAVGTVNDSSRNYAAATELLHNATLLHDDVVDGATERRGVPTVARLLGGPAAVLIGDYWLVACLNLILKTPVEPERVLRLFSATLGHLTEGELLQLECAGNGATTQADYLRIIYGKTASLFETAACSAAISVGASEEQYRAVGTFARNLGTAFQIKDDIFDYSEPSAALGKPVGIDLKEQKITQPLLCALETAPVSEQQRIRSLVAKLADEPEHIPEIQAFVKKADGVEKAAVVMEQYIREAVESLSCLPPSREKDALCALAEFVGSREK